MQTRSRSVQIRCPLPADDYHVFVAAQRTLRLVMGRKAPAVETLIQHTLSERTASGIADDYLEWVGWPQGRLPAAPVKPDRSGAKRSRRLSGARLRIPLLQPAAIVDPSRN